MVDNESVCEYICPFMSSWQGIKHCSQSCRFYISDLDGCVICNYMKGKR